MNILSYCLEVFIFVSIFFQSCLFALSPSTLFNANVLLDRVYQQLSSQYKTAFSEKTPPAPFDDLKPLNASHSQCINSLNSQGNVAFDAEDAELKALYNATFYSCSCALMREFILKCVTTWITKKENIPDGKIKGIAQHYVKKNLFVCDCNDANKYGLIDENEPREFAGFINEIKDQFTPIEVNQDKISQIRKQFDTKINQHAWTPLPPTISMETFRFSEQEKSLFKWVFEAGDPHCTRIFIEKMCQKLGWKIIDDADAKGFAPWYTRRVENVVTEDGSKGAIRSTEQKILDDLIGELKGHKMLIPTSLFGFNFIRFLKNKATIFSLEDLPKFLEKETEQIEVESNDFFHSFSLIFYYYLDQKQCLSFSTLASIDEWLSSFVTKASDKESVQKKIVDIMWIYLKKTDENNDLHEKENDSFIEYINKSLNIGGERKVQLVMLISSFRDTISTSA